jgi:hypothetical protein
MLPGEFILGGKIFVIPDESIHRAEFVSELPGPLGRAFGLEGLPLPREMQERSRFFVVHEHRDKKAKLKIAHAKATNFLPMPDSAGFEPLPAPIERNGRRQHDRYNGHENHNAANSAPRQSHDSPLFVTHDTAKQQLPPSQGR